MPFGRRHSLSSFQRLQNAVWPKIGWRRAIRYQVLTLVRLNATPHALALGLAIGVFAAFQPILGVQMLFAGALAWALRASIAAAMAGTFVGMPATWPFMWVASYQLGATIMGVERSVTASQLWDLLIASSATASTKANAVTGATHGLFGQVIWPLAVGAVPLGLLAGGALYVIVVHATGRARKAR